MYAAAIVDDIPADAEALARLVAASRPSDAPTAASEPLQGAFFEVRCFASADELARQLDEAYAPDIVFIDIVLDPATAGPAADGIEAVDRLLARSPRTQVIYVSGYDAFHTQVYRTPHAAYLRKPFCAEDVAYALDLALAARARTAEEPLCLKVKGADQVVEPAEIRYLESRLHVVRVHAARGVLEVYGKLSDLLDALPARFVRCHQSFAVNLDAVTSLDASSITLVSGEQVPVSRRMRAEVRAALFAHLRARRR